MYPPGLLTLCFQKGDSGGPVFLPVVVEWDKYDLSEQDVLNLAVKNVTLTNKTEEEVMNNIVRDPILIGVARSAYLLRFLLLSLLHKTSDCKIHIIQKSQVGCAGWNNQQIIQRGCSFSTKVTSV